MKPGTMFDSREIGKRIRRLIDGNYSYRKILVLIIICGGIFLYFGPPVAHWLFSSTGESVQGVFWTGLGFRSLAFVLREIIYEIYDAIWTKLMSHHMPLPTEDSLKLNARESYDKWNFQNCIGYINGKYIRIKCPTKSEIMFYNYKHYFSVVLRAVADAKYKFIYVNIGGYGKRSDGRTFMNSTLSSFRTKVLRLPKDDEFPNSDMVLPHLLGNDAYPLKSYNKERINNLHPFEEYCMHERLAPFRLDAEEYNVNILHNPPKEKEHHYLPYIGNGVFGIPILPDAWIYIKGGRALLLPVQWQPLISHSLPKSNSHQEATVTDFTNGIVHHYQCFSEKYYIEFQYYAHRVFDAIAVQDIKIVNPVSFSQNVPLKPQVSTHWSNSHIESIKIPVDDFMHEYNLISGFVPLPNSNKVVTVSILYKVPPRMIQVKPRSTVKLKFLTSIQYSEPIIMEEYHIHNEITKKKAIEAMKKVIRIQQRNLKNDHINRWQSYWYTSLRISDSKADGAINGHKINSTIYYVLSQISKGIPDVEKNVAMNEGCYRGHHTLDAPRLWKDTSTVAGVNNVVEAWLLTLEKQGCHHLITGDPSAVQQAIVLSLGSLRFSNQHLEFNIDPQYLHRDYLFRRISYGNVTHLNISVTVGEDNRAVLGVALDKSDSVYFGCDAGCLDAPVSLSQSYTNFPVKLTKPLTAILYITSDHQHMQDLQNALHVHAIHDAPAHDHLVMALHKHGHQLGGLPTLFWISICFLIIVFHLFLCKLIINEYYGHQDKQKVRYSKL